MISRIAVRWVGSGRRQESRAGRPSDLSDGFYSRVRPSQRFGGIEIEKRRTVVVGCGPAGLSAAVRMSESVVIEVGSQCGGLANSTVDASGFTWDCGAHFQFSHYDWFDDVLNECFEEDEWMVHERSTFSWVNRRFIPYPFQYNLHRLPTEDQICCVAELGACRAVRENGDTPCY